MLSQDQTTLEIRTNGQGLIEITDMVQSWIGQTGIATGQVTVFVRHTSASLTIQENADPDVRLDLETFFAQLVQENPSLYRHTCEGPDDMPAHIKSSLTDVSLTIPVADGFAMLGTWQGIYLFEHRRATHRRNVVLHLIGE
ncbi:secondary thiamine-phosphate synthase enzyme YjbQ [Thalassospira sp. GB04J01]|uniref:secondary thiamine-phosphate synthase enzyme YjbQ n=1 Tax=Thalassospira sp. GB04J01 TaxID=1485225 RepID=UPI0015F2D777|nr:secondary thiamine-phosphate synthase enzyme YjbQ [Thalassospira sp. GB04J01]|tara:strand:+ start:21207 stop:21629 length:423 start_codon:yes stop_codon:yes gene_type:complete